MQEAPTVTFLFYKIWEMKSTYGDREQVGKSPRQQNEGWERRGKLQGRVPSAGGNVCCYGGGVTGVT